MFYQQKKTTIEEEIDQLGHWIDSAEERSLASDFYKGEVQGLKIARDYLQDISDQEKAAVKNFAKGYEDAKAGYFDKWHRMNDRDGGKAYQAGSDQGIKEGGVIETIIESI